MNERPYSLKNLPLAHLAIAVKSLQEASGLYAALGFTLHEPEVIARENVRAQLAIKDGPGLHHVALVSNDVDADLAKLAKVQVTALKGYPATGMGGTRVAFLDPKTTGGVLFELVCQPTPA
jgi:methylmalonyl-CoA/ethylmalonyl-CoA epimerase